MTTEPDTWDAAAAELGFSDEQPVMKVASDEPEDGDAFDGWDSCSNWYWDNDFDCLTASDNSPTEMVVSVVICSDDEMVECEDNRGGGEEGGLEVEDVDESLVELTLTDGRGVGRDTLSNEDYLMQLQRKFSQATDFGGYNISSVSSSLNSSSDSSLCVVTETERKNEVRSRRKQEDREVDGSKHRSQTKMPSSLSTADTIDSAADAAAEKLSSSGNRVRTSFDSYGVRQLESAIALLHSQPHYPKELMHEFVQTVKEIKDRKRKIRKKSSSSKVSSFSNTEKSAFSQSGDNDLSASAGDHGTKPRFYFHTTGYSNSRSLRNDVLAVFSFAAGLGLVSGLFLGFLTSQCITPSANHGDNRRHNEFNCPRQFCQNGHQMILNSIWATKYEELVMENADLHLRLHQLNDKFSAELFQAQHIVAHMKREVGEISDDFGRLEIRSYERECAKDDIFPPPLPPAHPLHSLFSSASSSVARWRSESFRRRNRIRRTLSESGNQSKANQLYPLSHEKSSSLP